MECKTKSAAILNERKENVLSSPPAKRMKQACLSFGISNDKRHSLPKALKRQRSIQKNKTQAQAKVPKVQAAAVVSEQENIKDVDNVDKNVVICIESDEDKETEVACDPFPLASERSKAILSKFLKKSSIASSDDHVSNSTDEQSNEKIISDRVKKVNDKTFTIDAGGNVLSVASASETQCKVDASMSVTESHGKESSSDEISLLEDVSEDDKEVVCLGQAADRKLSVSSAKSEQNDGNDSLTADDLNSSINSSNADEADVSITHESGGSASKQKKRKRRSKEEMATVLSQMEEEKAKKRREREKVKLEREKMKNEKIHARQEAKEQREKEKAAMLAMKKEEKDKREQMKLQKKQQEEQEKQQKEIEKQMKEEEKKKKKLELLEAKQEEKRKKEMEKNMKELEANKKQEKLKAAFVSFFVKKGANEAVTEPVSSHGLFKPFQLKKDMKLAPACRYDASEIAEIKLRLDNQFHAKVEKTSLYLNELKNKVRLPRKADRTFSKEDEDDVQIVDENETKPKTKTSSKTQAKLLKFHENVRPPYWGTWSKKSVHVGPRKPFAKDLNYFDYEVDSDDEWEEEEPGESLSGTEDEKESEDEYEVDNEFFVPHGYLSDEEHNDDGEKMSPDTMKAKLKLKGLQFEEEMKSTCRKIKPVVLGCFWFGQYGNKSDALKKYMDDYEAVVLVPSLPIITKVTESPNVESSSKSSLDKEQLEKIRRKKKCLPEEAYPYLIKLFHGNPKSKPYLISEFKEFWKQFIHKETTKASESSEGAELPDDTNIEKSHCLHVSNRQLTITIDAIMKKEKPPETSGNKHNNVWIINSSILEKYNLTDLSLINQWVYLTKPKNVKHNKQLKSPESHPEKQNKIDVNCATTTTTSPCSARNENKNTMPCIQTPETKNIKSPLATITKFLKPSPSIKDTAKQSQTSAIIEITIND